MDYFNVTGELCRSKVYDTGLVLKKKNGKQ